MPEISKILLSPACTDGLEQEYVAKAFTDNWMAPQGPQVTAFENELREVLSNTVYPVLVTSGTAAIHLSLLALGVTQGDIVMVPTFTFVATVNPVEYVGATPVFIDAEPDTWNMSPEFLQQAIETYMARGIKPKAIITAAIYGIPCKYDEIITIAKQYGIPVLEDSAEALGSRYRDQLCGTLADIGVLSFNGNKIITMTSGGAVLCKTQEQAKQIRFLASQAKNDKPYYEHSVLGYNYAQSNILAAIGRAQLTKLNAFVFKRRRITGWYSTLFTDIEFVEVKDEFGYAYEDIYSNCWLSCVLIKDNELGKSNTRLKQYLEAHNIESRYLWNPLHTQPLYKDSDYFGNGVAESLYKTGLCLPSSPVLTNEDFTRIEQVIRAYFAG